MSACLYASGTCNHPECGAWPYDAEPRQGPTMQEECESHDHAYYGDDGPIGRCYCGARTYPEGGPTDERPTP